MTEYFFLNFADGLLRHCWGSNKHKKNYTCCPPLRMENFELFLPSFVSFNVPLFLENNSHERFQKCSWCYFDSHYTPKKLLNNTLFWSWLWVIFGLDLMYVLIFLENQSMFSHESLCRCSSYYSGSHPSNKIFISCHPWGPFCCMFLYILKTILFPWKFVQMFVALLWSSLHYSFLFISFTSLLKAMLGYFWIYYFSVCSSISWEPCKFFLMKFCADIFSITLTDNTLKKFFTSLISLLGAILWYFGVSFRIILGPSLFVNRVENYAENNNTNNTICPFSTLCTNKSHFFYNFFMKFWTDSIISIIVFCIIFNSI